MIRKVLKKNKKVVKAYSKLFDIFCSLLTIISPTINTKFIYKKSFNRKINLENPETFNEKLLWLKLNYYINNPLVIQCADKYAVREYVKSHGYNHILTELHGVYDNVSDIEWDKLPNKFALKWNFGCGLNLICDDKNTLNLTEASKVLKRFKHSKTYLIHSELQYKAKEKKLLCEKFIGSESGELPVDYKIFCFNGEPYCVCVYSDRDKETWHTNRCYFDFNWNQLEITTSKYATDPKRFKKPEKLDEMYEIAKSLSSPFPFVRVDLFIYQDKIQFGELTFTPTGGLGKSYSETANLEFGKLLMLPNLSQAMGTR